MAEVIYLLSDNYNIKHKPITSSNMKANAILKCAHQTIGNIICTSQLNKTKLDLENHWEGIISAVIFVTQNTVCTGPQVLVYSSPYPDSSDERPKYPDKVPGFIFTSYLTQRRTPIYRYTTQTLFCRFGMNYVDYSNIFLLLSKH